MNRGGSVSEFPTITHVALTVSDLNRSVPWYRALFGTEPVLDEDTGPFRHVVWATGQTLVALHQFPDGRTEGFDERRVGLDHLSFNVSSRAELEAAARMFDEHGVEHGPITRLAGFGIEILPFRDPDNIALELTAPVT